MMQSSTVKVHHRQNHHDNHDHNHPHSHRPRRRHHHHQKANKKRQLQQPSSIFGTGSDGDYISRYRHIIYLLIGIFFVSVQLRLLLWGYHASKIPVQGTQHEPLSHYNQQQQNHDRRQQQQQQQPRREDAVTNVRPDPDGYMNGFPIYYQDLTLDPNFHTRPYSQIHCVGENYQHHHHPTTHDLMRQGGGGDVDDAEGPGNDNNQIRQGETAWMKKSCHYRFLCLNLTSHEFQMYNRPALDTPLEKWSQQTKYVDKNTLDVSSSVMMTSNNQNQNSLKLNGVSLGAIGDDGNGLRWTPTVISDRPPPDKFYTLEDGVVFVPFFSLQGWDLKSLLWDDFVGMYNLLHIFQFDDSDSETSNEQRQLSYQPLLMRYVPLPQDSSPNIPTTSCDTNQAWYEQCQSMLQKYQSLMMTTTKNDVKTADSGSGSSTISGIKKLLTTQRDVVLQFSKIHNPQPDEQHPPLQTDLVCAKDGVAGIGPLTDHGTNEVLTVKHSHHYRHSNGVRSHNYGRGGVLWRFRRFCFLNLGLETHQIDHLGQDGTPHKMIISKSIAQRHKWLVSPSTFNTILKQDENVLAPKLDIEQYDFSTMEVKDSVQAVMDASVFVVDCNDKNDLIMAIFLPKGSSLIIYCDENDSDSNKKSNINDKAKKRKERDLLNNLSYVRVHWIMAATPATTASSDSDDNELFEQLLWRALQLQTTATAE